MPNALPRREMESDRQLQGEVASVLLVGSGHLGRDRCRADHDGRDPVLLESVGRLYLPHR